MEIEFFQLTDAGCVCAENADAIGCWPHEGGVVFAVADGLGIEGGGEIASALALEVLGRQLERSPALWPIATRLRRAVQEANLDIYQKAIAVPALRGMGATLLASAIARGSLVTVHVGDCRVYLFRAGRLVQLSKDHTSAALASRWLGRELIVSIDMLTLSLRPGDVIAQCSDGMYTMLREAEIADLLSAHPPAPACRALVRRAREEGGDDNLSIQIAAVGGLPERSSRTWHFGG